MDLDEIRPRIVIALPYASKELLPRHHRASRLHEASEHRLLSASQREMGTAQVGGPARYVDFDLAPTKKRGRRDSSQNGSEPSDDFGGVDRSGDEVVRAARESIHPLAPAARSGDEDGAAISRGSQLAAEFQRRDTCARRTFRADHDGLERSRVQQAWVAGVSARRHREPPSRESPHDGRFVRIDGLTDEDGQGARAIQVSSQAGWSRHPWQAPVCWSRTPAEARSIATNWNIAP